MCVSASECVYVWVYVCVVRWSLSVCVNVHCALVPVCMWVNVCCALVHVCNACGVCMCECVGEGSVCVSVLWVWYIGVCIAGICVRFAYLWVLLSVWVCLCVTEWACVWDASLCVCLCVCGVGYKECRVYYRCELLKLGLLLCICVLNRYMCVPSGKLTRTKTNTQRRRHYTTTVQNRFANANANT